MNEDEDTFDMWGLQDVVDALNELRAYLVQTAVICFACVLLCGALAIAIGSLATTLAFTALAIAAVAVALVQTAECSSEIIRLEQLGTWATKVVAVGPALSRGTDPTTASEGGASCHAS